MKKEVIRKPSNCFIFFEWDEDKKQWKDMTVIPPEDVEVIDSPLRGFPTVKYLPQKLIELSSTIDEQISTMSSSPLIKRLTRKIVEKEIFKNIPADVMDSLRKSESLLMDTDPMTGSFCYAFNKEEILGSDENKCGLNAYKGCKKILQDLQEIENCKK